MKNWLKSVMKMGPEALTIRAVQRFEDQSGIRAFLERPHAYSTPFEQPIFELFSKRAKHVCSNDAFQRTAVRHYFSSMPDFEAELVLARAELVRMGAIQCFGKEVYYGDFLDWHKDPFDETIWPRIHYTRVRTKAPGDFRSIWELGRLNWLSPLLNAFMLDGDPQWRLHYFSILRSFVRDNPVGEGVHWTNGQEVALRAIQVLIALRVFGDSVEEAEFRLAADFLFWHGRYVRTHFEFADLSLKNNHAIIEAGCLALLGLYFPTWEKSAEWVDRGMSALDKHRDQFSDDGGYVQHSHNYHRFVLSSLLYFECLGLNLGHYDAIFTRSLFYFKSLIQYPHGELANFGQNDSAMFGISNLSRLRDYRPFLNALEFRTHGTQLHFKRIGESGHAGQGRSHYLGILLFGDTFARAKEGARGVRSVHFEKSGIAAIHHQNTSAFLRTTIAPMQSGHDDFGHCDIWMQGENLTIDSGSFLYCSPLARLSEGSNQDRDPLMGAMHHCKIVSDQTRKRAPLGRFSWVEEEPFKRVLMEQHHALLLSQFQVADDWIAKRKVQCGVDEVRVIDSLKPTALSESEVELRHFTIRWIWPLENESDQGIDASSIERIDDGFTIQMNSKHALDVISYGASIYCEVSPTYHSPNYREKLPAIQFEIKTSSQSAFHIHSVFRLCESS